MNENQFLDKHYKRLVTEGILRSAIIGSSVCFGINSILAILYWTFAFGDVWLGLGIGLAVGAVSGILLYFLRYRPTEKEAARRIDRLGLEERVITMLELKDDDSYIAELQRKDAEKSLGGASAKNIRYRLSKTSVIIAAAILSVSVCLTVIGALAKGGKIPYGKDIFGFGDGGALEVVYVAGDGGRLFGEDRQSVKSGGSTSAVLAVADNGWIFIGWDDGERSPERYETDVSQNMVIRAVFEKIDNDGDAEDESDSADDTPLGSSSNDSSGGGSDEDGEQNPSEGNEGHGGGKWQDKNQFIDGATYYRDYLELYYQYATGIFDSNSDIPPEIIEFFEIYFSGI